MAEKSIIPATSPAFIIDQQVIQQAADNLAYIRKKSGCRVLYSIKALPFVPLLKWLQPYIDGFSVSSLFEAKLAHSVLNSSQSIHLATPGIRRDEQAELNDICTHISFNSLNQKEVFLKNKLPVSKGLRINPKLSFSNDERFDPCRLHSKLGLNIEKVQVNDFLGIEGIHLHTVFSQQDLAPIIKTLDKIELYLSDYLPQLEWVNLGGGYLLQEINNLDPLLAVIIRLREKYQIEVYLEPGKDIVNKAVSLVTTVIDCFESDGKTIAVLDSSINHNPEVFEFQRVPEVLEANKQGNFSALLVGSTCLAGDVFGEYRFNQAIQVGDKISFINVGAYTLVKANRFNGYNLPDIYSVNQGELKCLKHYDYENYRQQWDD
ncbi:MAG: carboxynorspermidine decarboxylase [Methyloprofundus sp.]|nr:carboxynorspermidine decarboxylase [Methyloprofundus sp.]